MSNVMQNLVTDAPDLDANDLLMAKQMADTLHKHYPGHLWAVTCDGKKGIATVRNLRLSGNMGYILRLPTITTSSDWDKRVLRAGGEVLERYRIARAGIERTMDQILSQPTDVAGRLIAERG